MLIYNPTMVLMALADDVIAGYRVKARDMVLISAFVAHRNPEYWPDPERFDPTRFANDLERELPSFVFFPFGAGHRRCVGADFALLQSRIIITRIAQRWRMRLVDGHPVAMEPMVTLRAKHGMRMHLSVR